MPGTFTCLPELRSSSALQAQHRRYSHLCIGYHLWRRLLLCIPDLVDWRYFRHYPVYTAPAALVRRKQASPGSHVSILETIVAFVSVALTTGFIFDNWITTSLISGGHSGLFHS
jgi:hypothetical protein